MITDENSLGEAMTRLTRTIANAIDMFEADAPAGATVELKWVAAGKSNIIPTEQMWRVSVEASLDTGTEQHQLLIHGDE